MGSRSPPTSHWRTSCLSINNRAVGRHCDSPWTVGPSEPAVPFLGAWEVAPLRVVTDWSIARRHNFWCALSALLVVAGCASEEAGEPTEADAGEVAAPATETDSADTRLVLSTDVARLTIDETVRGFPHGAHGGIVCAQCHSSVLGHNTHQTTDCVDCHQGSGFLGERVVFARDECMSCHHGAEQAFTCARCHGAGSAPVERTETVAMAVWEAPRERVLPFDHEMHQSMDCSECHSRGVLLEFDQTCATCHVDHHQPESDCASCHVEPTLEQHEIAVHLGCGGGGCHEDALPRDVEQVPAACLTCHQEQVDHEPGGDCATCHKVGVASDPQAGGSGLPG